MSKEVYQLQRIAGLLTEDGTVPPVTARDIIKSPDFVEIGPDGDNGSGEYFLIGTVAGRCYAVGCGIVGWGEYGNFEEVRQMKVGLTLDKLLNLAHEEGLIYCDRSPRPPRHLLCIFYNYEKFDEFLEEQTYGSFTAHDVDDLDEGEDIDLSDTPQFVRRPKTVEEFIKDNGFMKWLTNIWKERVWFWPDYRAWVSKSGYSGRRKLRAFVEELVRDGMSVDDLDGLYDDYEDPYFANYLEEIRNNLNEGEDIDLTDTPDFEYVPKTLDEFIKNDGFISWLAKELKKGRVWVWEGGFAMMRWATEHGYSGRGDLRPFIKKYLQDKAEDGILSTLASTYDQYMDWRLDEGVDIDLSDTPEFKHTVHPYDVVHSPGITLRSLMKTSNVIVHIGYLKGRSYVVFYFQDTAYDPIDPLEIDQSGNTVLALRPGLTPQKVVELALAEEHRIVTKSRDHYYSVNDLRTFLQGLATKTGPTSPHPGAF